MSGLVPEMDDGAAGGACGSPTPPAAQRSEPIGAELRAIVATLDEVPVYVTGRRGDVLAWNDLASVLYGYDSTPPDRRNVLLSSFTQPGVRRFILDWEEHARAAVATVRETSRQHPDDPCLAHLLDRLRGASPEFVRLWDELPGRLRLPVRKRFSRPPAGALAFSCTALRPAGHAGLRLWTYLPADETTSRRLRSLRASRRRSRTALQRRAEAVQRVRARLDGSDRDVSLDELAGLAGTDRFGLFRWFVAEVGVPPHTYQLLVRLQRARQLLAEGWPAADVAAATGFADQSHLIRQFRRLEGVTPGEYVRGLQTARRPDRG